MRCSPAGTASAVIAKLSEETARAIKTPEAREFIAGEGAEPVLTITANWFNRDDSPAPALARELTDRYGVDIAFTVDSYTRLGDKLELETSFLSKRWVTR